MDNHSLRRQKDEGHRGNAATDQRYGEKTRYHAVCRASPRERHQDPPEGRRCQRNGQEMSNTSRLSSPESTRRIRCAELVGPLRMLTRQPRLVSFS